MFYWMAFLYGSLIEFGVIYSGKLAKMFKVSCVIRKSEIQLWFILISENKFISELLYWKSAQQLTCLCTLENNQPFWGNSSPTIFHLFCRENDITSVLDHTFCVEHNAFGKFLQHELKPNGRNIPVTEENKREYVRYDRNADLASSSTRGPFGIITHFMCVWGPNKFWST